LIWNTVSENQNGYWGWVKSLEEAENVRRVFQAETSLTFVSGKKEAQFGRSEISKLVVLYISRSSTIALSSYIA
jgi:hypothetical protein